MDTKRCARCTIIKNIDQFALNKVKKDGHQGSCRDCVKQLNKESYKRTKGYQNPKRKATKERAIQVARQLVWDWLDTHPCVDCGETDKLVLQFDHVRGKKINNVSNLINRASLPKIQEEIHKCDVRCANCHLRKTAQQFGWAKLELSVILTV